MTPLSRRHLLFTAAAGLTGAALATGYPSRAVRVLVGSAPGGPADFSGRLLGEALQARFGQPVLVENRPGAAGTLAAEAVARAEPDGHTLLVGAPGNAVMAPLLYRHLRYDPARELVPVTLLSAGAYVLAVAPALRVRTLAAFIELARSRPRSLHYGSGGNGSSSHLAGELLANRLGVDLHHVPYKGDAQALGDLAANRIQFLFTAPNLALPYADSARLRLLGVTSRQRLAALPDVPTLIEAGWDDFEYLGWNIAFAPAGTPMAVIDDIAQAWSSVRDGATPTHARLEQLGMMAAGTRLTSRTTLPDFLQAERVRLTSLMARAGITPD